MENAKAGTELCLLGVCLAAFVGRHTQLAMENKLRQGCKMRLLIVDPGAEAVKGRGVDERRTYEDIGTDIEAADKTHYNFIMNHVPEHLRPNIQLGHYDSAPSYFIFSTHDTMIVGFYLRDGLGEFFPHLELEIKEGGIHGTFGRHFESLWEARRDAPPKSEVVVAG